MPIVAGVRYSDRTHPDVIRALECARARRERVHVYYGDPDTGRAWIEENDVSGFIGCSQGPVRVPLLIHPLSGFGPQLLDDCIVRIVGRRGEILYTHAGFTLPALEIVSYEHPRYAATVLADGAVHARFGSVLAATRFVDFVEGRRIAK